MNRQEVMETITHAGTEFGRVMACIREPEYVAGYYQAVNGMVRLFRYAPMNADFDSEREQYRNQVRVLREEKNSLKRDLRQRDAIIEKLMKHVDVCAVLCIEDVKR